MIITWKPWNWATWRRHYCGGMPQRCSNANVMLVEQKRERVRYGLSDICQQPSVQPKPRNHWLPALPSRRWLSWCIINFSRLPPKHNHMLQHCNALLYFQRDPDCPQAIRDNIWRWDSAHAMSISVTLSDHSEVLTQRFKGIWEVFHPGKFTITQLVTDVKDFPISRCPCCP